MISLDMYHNDNVKTCDNVKIFFNDCDGGFFGWIYKEGEIIGDFNAVNSLEIEETFRHLGIVWL